MAEVTDRLVWALLDATSRMNTVRMGLQHERARVGAPLQKELQAERARIKELLAQLDADGAIDLERVKEERRIEREDAVHEHRRELGETLRGERPE